MSTLVGLKLNNTVVLATDSLTYTYGRPNRIISDAQQKIFEVAPDVFYGWSGSTSVAMEQASIARALARTARPTNIRKFADELNAASVSRLLVESNRALTEPFHPAHSGELPFQAYILAGVSEGVPGFVVCEFSNRNGGIWYEFQSTFKSSSDRLATYITGDKSLVGLMNNPFTWVDGLITAGERFVDHLRRVTPDCVGGLTQMVHIDKSGARWVHRPVDGIGGVKLNYGAGMQDDGAGAATLNPGNGLGLSGSQLVQKLAPLGGLAFNGSGQTTANLGYTMQINSSNQVVLSNLPTVAGLPALPSTTYPAGSVVCDTVAGFDPSTGLATPAYTLYRNPTGSQWVASHTPADMVAGAVATGVTLAASQITAGSLIAGVVYAGQINTNQINAGTINGVSLNLVTSTITTTVNNAYLSGLSGYYGMAIYGYEPGWSDTGLYATPHGIYVYDQNTGLPGSGGYCLVSMTRNYSLGNQGVINVYDQYGNSCVIEPGGIFRNGVRLI